MRNEDFYDNENAEGLVFENAIEQNKLSLDLDDDRYVGRYMYMHSTLLDDDQIIDRFKNRDTKAFDVVATRSDDGNHIRGARYQWPAIIDDTVMGLPRREKLKNNCVLCGGSIGEWGNNPYPLAEKGECCNACNTERVVPERLRLT